MTATSERRAERLRGESPDGLPRWVRAPQMLDWLSEADLADGLAPYKGLVRYFAGLRRWCAEHGLGDWRDFEAGYPRAPRTGDDRSDAPPVELVDAVLAEEQERRWWRR